jgi:long-chain fatty acid transport protein
MGIAGRPISPLLLSGEIRLVNWSNTVDVVTFTGPAQGAVPAGYENQNMPFKMKWQDQVVLAVGAQVDVLKDLLRVRAGYNHASSPVKGDGINTLFPAVVQDHVTAGLGVTIIKGLTVDGAIELAFKNTVSSNSQNQMAQQPGTSTPNGYAFDVSMRQTTAHLGAGYQF